MKIALDVRMWGTQHAGIGRYVENLVVNLLKQDKENSYVLLVRKKDSGSVKFLTDKYPKSLKLLIAEVRHYSLKEQLLIPWILWREKPDLVHFPHFNVPLLYRGKFVITIHDLLWHEMTGKDVTTLPNYLYDIKYAGYRLVFANAIKRAQKILIPSNWIKNKLINTYKEINNNKVVVTHEGIDEKYTENRKLKIEDRNILEKYELKKPYLIYTGSVYPHKNLKVLLRAVMELKEIELLIACSRSVFWEKLYQMVKEYGIEKQAHLPGFVADEDLKILYQNALAFVFPSLSEGFGLPGLEAMASGCPVICSDIPVFQEIYEEAAIYFNPKEATDLVEKINRLASDQGLVRQLKEKGLQQAKKYSWQKMAGETLRVYNGLKF